MSRTLMLLLSCGCAAQAQRADVRVSYFATQASVQDVAKTLALQAGLEYNCQKSFDQTDPLCRRWVRDVRIEAAGFEKAMHQILSPAGLRYEIENGQVVLYRDANAPAPNPAVASPEDRVAPLPLLGAPDLRKRPISYSVGEKSVQYVVIDLAKLVGLRYNWNRSFSQTDPDCRRWVRDLSIKNQSFEDAMHRVLDPFGLRYEIEGGEVVLYRQ